MNMLGRWMRHKLLHGYRQLHTASAMSLKRPYEIFSSIPPNPAPWAQSPPAVQPQLAPSRCAWQECNTSISKSPLEYLECALRRTYQQRITWPTDESHLTTLPADQYLEPFLQPLTSLFTLYAPHALPSPVACITIDYGDSIKGVTFRSNPLGLSILLPVIISLPDAFDDEGRPSPRTFLAVSRVLEHNEIALTIIVTDFKNIAVFKPPPPDEDSSTALFERIETSQPLLALRALTLAHIRENVSGWVFAFEPADAEDDEGNLILPEGPPIDPRQPLLPDEEVFASHQRVSDFDGVTLVRDRSRALQFFRWRQYIHQQCPKLVTHPHDIVVATTRDTHSPPPPPLYPFELSELPSETLAHVNATRRKSPLASSGIEDMFMQSRAFTLEIDGVISEGSKESMCSVFRCHITSIDGTPVTASPTLCLKLFDDRFQRAAGLEEDEEELATNYGHYMKQILDADLHVLDEASAYDKLKPVQGSIVPWFYGAHKFTFGNGMYLYGILLEYIEGRSLLDTNFFKGLSTERQIATIRSCREGVRVLDIADIAQRDWHGGQVLIRTDPSTNLDHAVFVDFASAAQTRCIEEPNVVANYSEVLMVLRRAGLDRELVWQHFGLPDDWDATAFTFSSTSGEEARYVRARAMLPWISSPNLYPETQ